MKGVSFWSKEVYKRVSFGTRGGASPNIIDSNFVLDP